MLGVGFWRPPVLTALSAALLGALSLALARGKGRRAAAAALLAAVTCSLALYAFMSRRADAYESQLIPAVSVRGLDFYRKEQMRVGRDMARDIGRRELGTAIYPDVRFSSWGGVLAFVPKAAVTVLFMPLPGLYPLEGNIGRIAASAENVFLLLIALAAVAAIARGGVTPVRMGLLTFFGVMTLGAALLEIDLGSAGRHKLLYLPLLFPFAAEEVIRILRRPRKAP